MIRIVHHLGSHKRSIVADVANSACSPEVAESRNSPRMVYERGRALLAKHDVTGAKRQFELAVSAGYRAARVDLANLLIDASAGITILHVRCRSTSRRGTGCLSPPSSWDIFTNTGVYGSRAAGNVLLARDLAKAWSWYQKGADAGEPNALARFAERDEENALAENGAKQRTRCCSKPSSSTQPLPSAPTTRIGRTMRGDIGAIVARHLPEYLRGKA